jgi:hypothetical protein
MIHTYTDEKGAKVSLADLAQQLKKLDERLNSQDKVLKQINSDIDFV